jgi:hypothetical protein
MNILSAMTINVFDDIQLLSLASHAYLKQLVSYYLRAVRFVELHDEQCPEPSEDKEINKGPA